MRRGEESKTEFGKQDDETIRVMSYCINLLISFFRQPLAKNSMVCSAVLMKLSL